MWIFLSTPKIKKGDGRRMRKLFLSLVAMLCALLLTFGASAQVLELEGKAAKKDLDAVIERIRAAEGVERVVFDNAVLTPEILQALRDAFPDLEMEYSVSILGKRFRSTADTINLYKAAVNGERDFEKFIAVLPWLPNVREIRALDSSFTYEQMVRIHEVLPDVHLSTNLLVNRRRLRTDITAFCTRHSLTTKNRYSSDDMRVLKYMDNLLALDVGHNAVTNLDFLYDLPDLRVLILADNQVTDLTPIASLTELEYLEVFLNDELSDLSPLAGLTNLIDLHIGSCNISDLSPLMGLTSLDRLWLGDNPYDEAQLEQLRQALPNCTINSTAWMTATTAEGWRQGHPRYLTIVDMFESGRYKEFKK